MSGTIAYGDEIEKYRVAQSIIERGQVSFRPTAVRNIANPEGRTVSLYELGQTLLEIPFYAAGRFLNTFFPTADPNQLEMLIVGLLNPLLSALTCVAMFQVSRAMRFRPRTALTLAVMYGGASIALPYAGGYAREPLLSLTLLIAVGATLHFEQTRAMRWLLVAGLAVGYLAFSKFIHAMVIPFLLVYVLYVIWRDTEPAKRYRRIGMVLFVFFAPVLAFALFQAVYSFVRFGDVAVGYSTKVNPFEWIISLIVVSAPQVATPGLLFSLEKGFLLYNPLAILGFWSMPLWWRQNKPQAKLILALLAIEFVAVILRPDWDGGTWWGPRYLVQLTPLLILSLGFLLESPFVVSSRVWQRVILIVFVAGVAIGILGALGNERDYLDVTGKGITILGQLDLLRYGVLDSLFVNVPPNGLPVQLNRANLIWFPTLLAFGALIYYQWSRDRVRIDAPLGLSFAIVAFMLAIELSAFLLWIVAPYPQVLVAKGNTRFLAAERLLNDGRVCEARVMYSMASDRDTTFYRDIVARFNRIYARGEGLPITADDLMNQIEISGNTRPDKDYAMALTPEGALRLMLPSERDATVMLVSTPIPVTPNTRYELSGWWKTLNIYGTRYASVALYQDDGNWDHRVTTDIALMDETRGWQPFRYITSTLPTTQRVMIKVALWQTHGTVWVDDVRLVENPASVNVCK